MSDMNPFGHLPNLLADVQVYVDLIAKSKAVPPRHDATRTATLSMFTAILDLGYKVSLTTSVVIRSMGKLTTISRAIMELNWKAGLASATNG
jgi:hypothetical protein